nr:phospholipase D-like domain-containing protein [uncultured Pseudodesulfovibrio sp.]
MTTIIEKKHEKTVDQTMLELPPVWIKQAETSTLSEEFGSIFTSGKNRVVARELEERILEAEHSIVLCSFLLADEKIEDALFEASQKGVRIFVMLACETRLDADTPDDDFGKMCLNQHKKMLKRFAGKMFIRSAPFFHAKVVLIDALSNSDNSSGILLTANLTQEALERNEEIAIEMSPSEVTEVAQVLGWALFEYAEHEVDVKSHFSPVKPLKELSYPRQLEHICYTSEEETGIRDRTMALIEGAKEELLISSFGWDSGHPTVEAICQKARDGVRVTILSRIRPAAMDALIKMREAGAEVLGFNWLHAKAVWNESGDALVMSANFQKHGMDEGFELGVKLSGQRSSDLHNCLQAWKRSAPWQLEIKARLGEVVGKVKLCEPGKQAEVIEISKGETIPLSDITARCATSLDAEAQFPELNWRGHPHHAVNFVWKVVAPQLPPKSKEVFWYEEEKGTPSSSEKQKKRAKQIKHSYDPKVFRLPSGEKVIAINEASELNKALALKLNPEFLNANIVVTEQTGGV